MNRDEFESKVLELWMKSRIPLTLANLQYFAEVPRRQLRQWLDELAGEGVVDLSLEERPELEYVVPGAKRPADGATSCQEYERKRAMIDEAKRRLVAKRSGKSEDEPPRQSRSKRDARRRERTPSEDDDGLDIGEGLSNVASTVGKVALVAGGKAMVALDKPLNALDKPRGDGEKSLLLSAGLSLLGPPGWLYAGSFREAVPATAGYIAILSIVPGFLLAPFLTIGMLASSAAGLTYAWQYNRKRRRTPLLLKPKKSKGRDED